MSATGIQLFVAARRRLAYGMSRRLSLLLLLALTVPAVAFAYQEEPTHRHITRFALTLLAGDHSEREARLYAQTLEDETVAEDDGNRCVHHFYDPTTRLGLPATSLVRVYAAFAPANLRVPSIEDGDRYSSAAVWARDGMPDLLDWEAAIEAYGDSTRGEAGHEAAWKALGHVLHLIQDMAQPDHARDRMHPGNGMTEFFDALPGRRHMVGYEELWKELGDEWPHGKSAKDLESLEQAFDEVPKKSQAAEVGRALPMNDELALGLGEWTVTNAAAIDTVNGVESALQVLLHGDARLYGDSLWQKFEIHVPVVPTIPLHPSDARTEAYISLGKELLPLAEEYSAGLVKLFYRIVNPPPFVESVTITQEGDSAAGYSAEWSDADRSRSLERRGSGNLVAGKIARMRIEFGPRITLKGESFREEVFDPKVHVIEEGGESVPVAEDSFTGDAWTGHFIPQEPGTLVIETRDTDPHFTHRNEPGDVLDSDPSSIARAGKSHPYDWRGYEPGPDRNHHFGIVGSCPPGTVDAKFQSRVRWAEVRGTFRMTRTGSDGVRDPQDKKDPAWEWSGMTSDAVHFLARCHWDANLKDATIGRLLDSSAGTGSDNRNASSVRAVHGTITMQGSTAGEYLFWIDRDSPHTLDDPSAETRKHGPFYFHITQGRIAGHVCADGSLEGAGHASSGSPDWVEKTTMKGWSVKQTAPYSAKHYETAHWTWEIAIEPVTPPQHVASCEKDHDANKRAGAVRSFETTVGHAAEAALVAEARQRRDVAALARELAAPHDLSLRLSDLHGQAMKIDDSCRRLDSDWISPMKDADTRYQSEEEALKSHLDDFAKADEELRETSASWAELVAGNLRDSDPAAAKRLIEMAKKVRDSGLNGLASDGNADR